MANVTFDGPNTLIIVNNGVTLLDAEVDLYSDWKEWVMLADNAKYLQAFRTIGGDPLGSGLEAGSYFFLQNQNGWRVRPYEGDHELVITGNLYAENPALPLFVPTLGNYTVLTALERSSLTQYVATDVSTLWEELQADHTDPLTMGGTIADIKTKTDTLPAGVPRATALPDFAFVMRSAGDHISPVAGLSIVAERMLDGGAWGPLDNAGAIFDAGYGAYTIDLTANDLDALVVMLRFTALGADDLLFTIKTGTAA